MVRYSGSSRARRARAYSVQLLLLRSVAAVGYGGGGGTDARPLGHSAAGRVYQAGGQPRTTERASHVI